MNRLRLSLAAVTCMVGIQGVAFGAEESPVPETGSPGAVYIGAAGAAAILMNVHVHPMDSPLTPGRAEERFKVGEAGAAVIGYAFGNGFAVELEGAYEYNNVNKLSPVNPFVGKQTGHQESYGGFINGTYSFNLKESMGITFVSPYVGAGIGTLFTHVTLPEVLDGGQIVNHIGGTSGPNFAYQGFVGLAFPVPDVPGLAVFTDYRFIGVDNPDTLKSNFYAGGTLSKGNIKLSPAFVHLFTLGVAYAFGAAPPPPPPMAAPPVAPAPSRTYLVFFDWDKSNLTDRARQIIAEAAQNSTRVQSTRIDVQGNADRSGTPAYNQKLSLRRADVVAAELVRDGVAKGEINIQAFGDTRPLVPTAAGVREPQNRRVEIILH